MSIADALTNCRKDGQIGQGNRKKAAQEEEEFGAYHVAQSSLWFGSGYTVLTGN